MNVTSHLFFFFTFNTPSCPTHHPIINEPSKSPHYIQIKDGQGHSYEILSYALLTTNKNQPGGQAPWSLLTPRATNTLPETSSAPLQPDVSPTARAIVTGFLARPGQRRELALSLRMVTDPGRVPGNCSRTGELALQAKIYSNRHGGLLSRAHSLPNPRFPQARSGD